MIIIVRFLVTSLLFVAEIYLQLKFNPAAAIAASLLRHCIYIRTVRVYKNIIVTNIKRCAGGY